MDNIDLNKIKENLIGKIADYNKEYGIANIGSVITSADGVIKISGLSAVKYNEILSTANGAKALALNLEKDEVGAIVLTGEELIKPGDTVYSSGKVLEVPVGRELLGRVVDPLGKPLDGLGDLNSKKSREMESNAPGIMERSPVDTPLQTGIFAIDTMIPIGRGQRELIIGDRQTGKTAIAIDTILNQKGKGVFCVYVAIGQKASTITNILNVLKEHNALNYTTIVCSTANDSASLQYLAPYAGCAIAEEFMYSGKDALIIYDDLTKHAVAYRAMSLLLKRPPGREAYPGDIFYLHSRLLERAAKLSHEIGGGSLTALPIIETLAGDISAYIPTNVISITDGQIYLESELFNSGIRPAINVGLSVSRVGGAAQVSGMRKFSGKLRIDLAQYKELAVFSQFGSDLDKSTREILAYGNKLTELLKQKRYMPYSLESMCVLLYAFSNALLNDVPLNKTNDFKEKFVEYFFSRNKNIKKEITSTKNVSEAAGEKIKIAVAEFFA